MISADQLTHYRTLASSSASRADDAGRLARALSDVLDGIEDVEKMHAQYLAEDSAENGAYDFCDEATSEAMHHAATCALAHAVWILRNTREERERQRRETFERCGLPMPDREED